MFPEKEIDTFARSVLESEGQGAHTYDHTRRVLALSMKIGQETGANKRILGAASLLHDIGRPNEQKTGESHSISSGRMSKEFLKSIGYSDDEIEEVVSAIRTHRFSEGVKPTSLEGRILSDADKIDAIGAVGVFRAIAQASVSNKGIDGFLQHADEKLLRLKDLLYTEAAKDIAIERHTFLESFVTRLRNETNSH
ncbi:MAG: HD domain-containing protein [Candidatus Thorarchaeota archaeon]